MHQLTEYEAKIETIDCLRCWGNFTACYFLTVQGIESGVQINPYLSHLKQHWVKIRDGGQYLNNTCMYIYTP